MIDSGCQLSAIGMFIQNVYDGYWANITYNSTNIKFIIWSDNNGYPDFSKPLGNTELTYTRQQDLNWQFLSWALPTPIKDKKLVWIGFKCQDILPKTRVNAGNPDINDFGYIFPDVSSGDDLDLYCNTGYAVPNCPYSDAWMSSYSGLQESGSGYNPGDQSPVMFLGKISKV
jgi:hypothetical protein